jgi:hypothetical protein
VPGNTGSHNTSVALVRVGAGPTLLVCRNGPQSFQKMQPANKLDVLLGPEGGTEVISQAFIDRKHDDLAKKVQQWLDGNTYLAVSHLVASSNNHGHCVTIFGERQAVASQYHVAIHFCRTGLWYDEALSFETALERAIKTYGPPVHVAQSANEVGHVTILLHRQ